LNLVEYRSLVEGYSRNHHFNIGFSGDILNDLTISSKDAEIISYLAFSTTTPVLSLEAVPIQVQYGLPKINMVGNAAYSSWAVTFYCDEKKFLRSKFLKWQNKAISFINGSRNFNELINYKGKAFMSLLGNDNTMEKSLSYKMVGIFPNEVGPITVQQQDTGITTFDVQFVYDYFDIIDSNDELFDKASVLTTNAKEWNKQTGTFDTKLSVIQNKASEKYENVMPDMFKNGKTSFIDSRPTVLKEKILPDIPFPLVKGQIGGNMGFAGLTSAVSGLKSVFGTIGGPGSGVKRGR
jgi:hypothetical protein